MATTEHLKVKPDYYSSSQECDKGMREKIQSNPRYRGFNQARFHAGDTEQFETYRSPTNGQVCIPDIDLSQNTFDSIDFSSRVDWDKYRNLTTQSVTHTFEYMFHKFKKGTFVKIQNNRLLVYLPFSKANFVNEWGDRMKPPPPYKEPSEFFAQIAKMERRNFNRDRVNRFPNTWWGNNCIIRYEYPPSEHDSGVGALANMLEELCQSRKLPDLEFFLNKRDFPLLRKDSTEPYDHLYDGHIPLISHEYSNYSPILSMTTTDEFADVPIPTWEDWARVSPGKFFPKSCRDYEVNFSIPWKKKKPMAVFRGSSTGCGVTINTNMRLKVAYLSMTMSELLDAGITDWNLRPRKLKGSPYLSTIDIQKLPFGLSAKMSPEEQAQYKYIVNIDGHSSAYRLSLELGMGSVILLVASKYRLWFRDLLVPYVHYVPVKGDLSDLIEKIKWCRAHDAECETIAKNARQFYDTFLSKKSILDYLQKLLIRLKQENGVYLYNYLKVAEVQLAEEKTILSSLKVANPEKRTPNAIPPLPQDSYYRSFGLLKGVEWALRNVPQIVPRKTIAQTRSTKVDLFQFAGRDILAVKHTAKQTECLTHEEFVGLSSINGLLQFVPNFTYIFGCFDFDGKSRLISEYIPGETLESFLQGNAFTLSDYLWILIQICLTLQVAQNLVGFVHYDTYPWNVIIQKLDQAVTIDYVLDTDIVQIKTSVIPILIDYGKSHVIYQNKYYGVYRTNTIQDVLSILYTTIYQIAVKRNLSKGDQEALIRLGNFVTGGTYRSEPFTEFRELKAFLHTAHKYASMLADDKKELEEKRPLDLIDYILDNFDYQFPLKMVDGIEHSIMDRSNAKQVYEFIFSHTLSEQLNSYVTIFDTLKACSLPQPTNFFFSHYVSQNLVRNITSVYQEMINFVKLVKQPLDYYQGLYTDAINYLDSVYGRQYTLTPVNYQLDDYGTVLEYDQNTFQLPKPLMEVALQLSAEPVNLLPYQRMVMLTLYAKNRFSLSSEVREFYLENFQDLLSIPPLHMNNSVASQETFVSMATLLLEVDIEEIEKQLEIETGDCRDAQRILAVYKEVLDILGD